jgi:hypothetical protein
VMKILLFVLFCIGFAHAEDEAAKKLAHDQTFKVQYSQSFLRVEGEADSQNKGSIKSSSIPGFAFTWTPFRFEKAQFGISYGYQNAHFKPSESRTIVNDDQELVRYSVGGNYNVTKNFDFNFQIGRANQIFYHSLDAFSVKLDSVQVDYAQIGFQYDFLKFNQFMISAKGAGRLHAPFHKEPYKGKYGEGYTGSLVLTYGRRDFLLLLEGFVSRDKFHLKVVDFERIETGIIGGLIIPIGGPL